MTTIPITCPKCGYRREVPGERVPDRQVQVTCPHCKATFPFSREPEAVPLPTGTAPRPAPLSARHTPPPMPVTSPPARKAETGPRPTATGRRQQPSDQPATRAPAGRPLLKTVRLVILSAILLGTIVYALRERIPLQKIRATVVPSRQVIVIPPPAGAPPALPAGSVTVKVTAGEPGSAGTSVPSSPTGARFMPYDFPVFIYAVNLTGKIRVNGQDFKDIKGEPDMQYSINSYGEPFRYGANSIELALAPATGGNRSLNPELEMRVSRLVGGVGGERRVIGQWKFTGQGGWPRTVSLEIPEVGQ